MDDLKGNRRKQFHSELLTISIFHSKFKGVVDSCMDIRKQIAIGFDLQSSPFWLWHAILDVECGLSKIRFVVWCHVMSGLFAEWFAILL